jgi:anti-sigma B factor antagonist
MAELQINSQVLNGVPIVSLHGELDSYSAVRLRQTLEILVEADRPMLLIDMVELDYIDSSGLGVLVAALKQISDRAGMLGLIGPNADIVRILRITGLNKLFTVYGNEAEALSGFARALPA